MTSVNTKERYFGAYFVTLLTIGCTSASFNKRKEDNGFSSENSKLFEEKNDYTNRVNVNYRCISYYNL